MKCNLIKANKRLNSRKSNKTIKRERRKKHENKRKKNK